MTDYERFMAEANRLGAKRVGRIGNFDGKFYDGWQVAGQGFILARNHTGRIGIYAFVGKDGAPVEDDIQWLTDQVDDAHLAAVDFKYDQQEAEGDQVISGRN